MLTIIFSNDGRTWYGRKRYKVRLENAHLDDHLVLSRMSVADSISMIRRIVEKESAEGREFRIIIDKRR